MILAGLQNLSLVDYPGCLAATVFTQGCNFYCPYCQNPDLVTCDKKFNLSEEEVLSYLDCRKDMLEGVVITGGEPVLQKDLPEFIEKIKDLGLKVKLDTNGSDPNMIENLLKKSLIDHLAVDIKTSMDKYSLVTRQEDVSEAVSMTIRLAKLALIPCEFRTTCAPGIVEEKDFKLIGKLVQGAKKYYLQQFRPDVTYDNSFQKIKPFSQRALEGFRDVLKGYVEEVKIRGL